MEIIRIGSQDAKSRFEEVTRLHIASIHLGVLPLLGEPFLTRLYTELARAPRTGLWGVIEAGKVVGFLCGCADVRATYRAVLSRGGIALLLLASRSFVNRQVCRKLFSVVSYAWQPKRHSVDDLAEAELLAIAVDESCRGRGIGKSLVQIFEESLSAWDARGCYRVATNIDEPSSNKFYQRLGFVRGGIIPHHDLVLQMYQKPIPNPNVPRLTGTP
jgi:ribosomal protein S18 acetylase RimI-like enzyme